MTFGWWLALSQRENRPRLSSHDHFGTFYASLGGMRPANAVMANRTDGAAATGFAANECAAQF
jgi:hypothetical protein